MEDKSLFTAQHRYNSLTAYLQNRFHRKIFKVALNGNFTCPNRDGTISTRGCIFCSPSGSGDFAGNKNDSLQKQFDDIKNIIHHKWKDAGYIAYFQANTNTYKPLDELKKLYEEAISLNNDIVALSIATRPDSITIETMDYLENLNKRIPIWIELGLQTINEKTAKLINRGYELSCFENAVNNLRKRGIEVIVHIINGLPFETETDMYNTIRYLNKLDIQGIKIHSLFILKGTELEKLYYETNFHILTMEEYVKITCKQIAMLRNDIIIHRINGDAPIDLLIEPKWSIKKLVCMNEIDKYLKVNNLYQGKNYS